MKASDYEGTIAEIQADYERGEYQDDPEMAGRRRSREQQEELDRRLAEEVFVSPLRAGLDGTRTLADVELELAAGRLSYRAAPWLGPQGPMAIPEVSDDPKRFAKLIDLWRTDPEGYERHLRMRRLIR